MAPGYLLEVATASPPAAKERYSHAAPGRTENMATETNCERCGAPMEAGFLSTSNGSGLFWSQEATSHRLRPSGLEIVVPTGFMGTYSANLRGHRCRKCGTIVLETKSAGRD